MFDSPFDNSDRPLVQEQPDHSSADDFYLSDDRQLDEQSQPPSRRGRLMAFAAVVLTLAAGWWLLSSTEAPAITPPVPTVVVAAPLQREIVEWDEFIGRFEASRSVEVRPRVSGQITQVHFTDGQYVRAGAPLFTIDPRPYSAALLEVEARVASAQSALALARSELARAERLIAEDAIAANEIDRLQAEVRAHAAAVASARAQVASRRLDVEFTIVRAPMAGRISDRRVDAGNLVAAGAGEAATLLTTINAVDPLHFTFEGSESLYLKARREGLDNGALVEIRLADETAYERTGSLDFTDNALDPQSGTIRARAIVRNPDGLLAPGLFGNMRMATGGTTQALLVPDTSVTTDQTRKLLLVVDGDGLVATREVELGPLVGNLRVIRSGLQPEDRVVIEGVQSAMPGSTVNARLGQIAPSAAAAAAPPPRRSAGTASSATIAN